MHFATSNLNDVYSLTGLNIGLLLLRIATGVVMVAHGYNHIWGGGKIPGTARWFESLGLRPGVLHAWLASIVELGAGTMLILGLLTPLAATGLVAVISVAILTIHRHNGFFIFRPGEGWEYTGTLVVVGLALSAMGGGGWSLDRVFGIDLAGITGLLIGVVGGFGGAIMLLAIFKRPVPATESSTDG
ncbi:MAG: DoxX family protein [Actinomycetes bacterium]